MRKKKTPVIEVVKPEKSRAWLIGCLALIIIASALPFIFSLRSEFVLDDRPLILNDPLVHSLNNAPKAFTTGFLKGFDKEPYYYRPLVTLSYMLNYAQFGPNPLGFKLTNLLMHLITALLVFALARRLIKNDTTALFASLLFALHPAHTESVAWVSGRTDLMAALFGLASFLFFVKYTEQGKPRHYVLSILLFTAGMLSKEIVMIIPGMFLLYSWLIRKPKPTFKRAVLEIVPLIALILCYFVIRREVLGYSLSQHPSQMTFQRGLFPAGYVVLWYLRILFLPGRAEPVYDILGPAILHPIVAVVSWMAVLVMLGGLAALYRRSPKVTFAGLWTLAVILPATNIVPIPNPVPAERLLYLPSFGFCLLFGMAAAWFVSLKPKQITDIWPLASGLVLTGLLGFCGLQTWSGAPLWSSDISVAKRMIQRVPRYDQFHLLLASVYRDRAENGNFEDYQKAIEECKAAEEISPKRPIIHRMLADMYRRVGSPKLAAQEAAKLTKLVPADGSSFNLLGASLAESGDIAGATAAFEKAAQLAPDNPAIQFNLARAYARSRNYDKAVRSYREGLDLRPDDDKAKYELGLALRDSGRTDEARNVLTPLAENGSDYAPRAVEALKSLGG